MYWLVVGLMRSQICSHKEAVMQPLLYEKKVTEYHNN